MAQFRASPRAFSSQSSKPKRKPPGGFPFHIPQPTKRQKTFFPQGHNSLSSLISFSPKQFLPQISIFSPNTQIPNFWGSRAREKVYNTRFPFKAPGHSLGALWWALSNLGILGGFGPRARGKFSQSFPKSKANHILFPGWGPKPNPFWDSPFRGFQIPRAKGGNIGQQLGPCAIFQFPLFSKGRSCGFLFQSFNFFQFPNWFIFLL